ncbi:MAG: metal-dependent hydrolase [Clostridiales bacterium]|nr:metal-dependent hydrolase [Clostridiales bacterium]
MKTLSFTFNGNVIEYTVTYRNRKSIGISISTEKGLQVFAPKWVNIEQLHDVLKRKAPWILKNQAAIKDRIARKPEKNYIDGENFLYLGDKEKKF